MALSVLVSTTVSGPITSVDDTSKLFGCVPLRKEEALKGGKTASVEVQLYWKIDKLQHIQLEKHLRFCTKTSFASPKRGNANCETNRDAQFSCSRASAPWHKTHRWPISIILECLKIRYWSFGFVCGRSTLHRLSFHKLPIRFLRPVICGFYNLCT